MLAVATIVSLRMGSFVKDDAVLLLCQDTQGLLIHHARRVGGRARSRDPVRTAR